jgi:hypothetical protein
MPPTRPNNLHPHRPRNPHRAQEDRRGSGDDHRFAINVLAPYLLTALVERPQRLVYLSSGMHRGSTAAPDDPQWTTRRWSGAQAYSDSKLFGVAPSSPA